MNTATAIEDLLGLQRRPVAVKFQDAAPEGISRIDQSAVSGCTYWKLAAEGRTFYTEASDHFGCPIGAHTHGIDLPEATAKELEGMVGTMVELQYIAMEEVPGIPQLAEEFGVAIYAPLAEATFEPDAILVSGNAKQMMLLAESAHAAGVSSDTSMVGRPTCAAIPAVMQSGTTATNLGCIGNRVYTGLADDELYFIIAGPRLGDIVEKLTTILNANNALEAFHQGRMTN
ncbi:MAG: DUF169 domain-containing protein [Planctomycetota bacterium]|nr:DUF169 domain-containing protein [Planctomycetota bacterium]